MSFLTTYATNNKDWKMQAADNLLSIPNYALGKHPRNVVVINDTFQNGNARVFDITPAAGSSFVEVIGRTVSAALSVILSPVLLAAYYYKSHNANEQAALREFSTYATTKETFLNNCNKIFNNQGQSYLQQDFDALVKQNFPQGSKEAQGRLGSIIPAREVQAKEYAECFEAMQGCFKRSFDEALNDFSTHCTNTYETVDALGELEKEYASLKEQPYYKEMASQGEKDAIEKAYSKCHNKSEADIGYLARAASVIKKAANGAAGVSKGAAYGVADVSTRAANRVVNSSTKERAVVGGSIVVTAVATAAVYGISVGRSFAGR